MDRVFVNVPFFALWEGMMAAVLSLHLFVHFGGDSCLVGCLLDGLQSLVAHQEPGLGPIGFCHLALRRECQQAAHEALQTGKGEEGDEPNARSRMVQRVGALRWAEKQCWAPGVDRQICGCNYLEGGLMRAPRELRALTQHDVRPVGHFIRRQLYRLDHVSIQRVLLPQPFDELERGLLPGGGLLSSEVRPGATWASGELLGEGPHPVH